MNTLKVLAIASMGLIASSAYAQNKIMLFGGQDHDVYLGRLNCSEFAPDAIGNDIGTYGSDISPTSIFNDISQYGSDISPYSPCNDIANYPPVIVDNNGKFYGYLTLNDILPKAVTDPKILSWLKHKVCKQ